MTSLRKCSLQLAVAAALAAASPAFAGTVGGTVGAINTLVDLYINNIVIDPTVPVTDEPIVVGTIDNNSDTGWSLTVTSANVGKLTRGGGAGGAGNQILYTNIKLVQTGGTLGAGLTNPNGTTRNIVTGASGGGTPGTTIFNTGTAVGTPGTATTATVNYGYSLRISWSADTSLLSGAYTDVITLVLANDI
jgi:hypothetical protein